MMLSSLLPVLSGGGHEGSWLSSGELWALINFVLLVVLIVRFGGQPIKAAIEARRTKVAEEVSAVEGGWRAAEAALEACRAEGAAVAARIEGIGAGARSMADGLVSEILAEARAEAARVKAAAAGEADRIRRSHADEVRRRIVEGALARAESSLASRLGPEQQVRLFDDFAAKVAEVKP
ncbi:MAG: hypothetical protein VKO21_08165 [Candidatus Sericytochromatia bacterium]|nr:hypothetical protein [Candidatus Sericytochromatia bacterium]